ncbi:glycoside hydrolase family 2 protein [Microlunatus capsulatus]|uniref:Beta-galactosidase/beta-glucuronidase n=1 Tax=Microlunatus capsulatus TaxID=99117 RepID=A0ABS4ZCQ2_9ACTN|nr:sugar-binding domain-containing protein [Microlunatus capsulatus]MBP2418530.1 beta-galactosidase/beta-glucuronidase [Microlunatus capsulatus]
MTTTTTPTTTPATDPALPRPEYPRPQMVRSRWLCLNGSWEFEVDRSDSGLERGLLERPLAGAITVPFAPESEASGVGDVDYLGAVWYRRTVAVPAEWGDASVLLHLGAVDHDATVWVDGTEVVRHRGGFTPVTADLTGLARGGQEVTVVVRARDPKEGPQARGKQSVRYANRDCHYTRTTGIWQTVWMEPVHPVHLRRPRVTPQLASSSFAVTTPLSRNLPGSRVTAVLSDADGEVARAEVAADLDLAPSLVLAVPEDRRRTWSPEDPHLYDLELVLTGPDGELDRLQSYAGLRSVALDGDAVLLNGRHVFQRLVLDQGYWPQSLMTAPSDQALVDDIRLGQEAGFNGARLHQKVFEERYLHHADRLGYLVWGEFADWGAGGHGVPTDHQQPTASFVTQWLEALQRDHNHPAIIGWCPLNETYQPLGDRVTQLDDVTRAMFLATKLADPSRPVLDASGYSHRVLETDIWDSHNYEQDPAAFAEQVGGLAEGRGYTNVHDGATISQPHRGQPYFVSEFGGIWWNAEMAAADAVQLGRETSWGYGQRVGDEEAFYVRFAGLVDALLDDPGMFGYCYTQLTDTFQEQNGIYDERRRPKFDTPRLHAVQTRAAAYEAR